MVCPHMISSKSSPSLSALPSPINMIKQHTKFHPTARSPGKADHWAIHCPMANFEPLSRGSITNPMSITMFDTYLINPRVTWSLGLSQDSFDSECSALTHFSRSLAHKCVNIKDSYNLDIKEQVVTKNCLKRKTDFT